MLADELGAHRLGCPDEMAATRGRLSWAIRLSACGNNLYIVLAAQHFRHRLLDRTPGAVIMELLFDPLHMRGMGVLERKRAFPQNSLRAGPKQRSQVKPPAFTASQ
jgi:hypothetical protein